MEALDIIIIILILIFIALIVWSRIMQQSMLDTVVEIKDILSEVKK
jgi:hypothetical protein